MHMKILSALILLLSCSVCSAVTVTAKLGQVTTRENGDQITGTVEYLIYADGVEQVATTELTAEFEAEPGQVLCARARVKEDEIPNISSAGCKTLPFAPSIPEIQIQIIFTVGQ